VTLSNASFPTHGGGPVSTASTYAGLGLMRELAYELTLKIWVDGVAVVGMRTNRREPHALVPQARCSIASWTAEALRG
jgi:hypothetical protein